MEDKIFCEDDEENRSSRRYHRLTKESRRDYRDSEEDFGFSDSFDAIWEGR
ncbi:MAG: hypothetical protein HY282_05115 [Nitrospirae bacterium]|nr:hypothetical protein [Candidatus Manganitrophaceae bacterium]